MIQEFFPHLLQCKPQVLYRLYKPLPSTQSNIFEQEDDFRVPNTINQTGTQNSRFLDVEGRHSQKRITNNSFKILLNEYKKIIYDSAVNQKQQQQIKEATKKVNMSTFPKLIFLSQKWRRKKLITEVWNAQFQERIIKFGKKDKRHSRMTQALQCRGWKKAIKEYWGQNIVHRDKYENSIRQVKKFRNKEFK